MWKKLMELKHRVYLAQTSPRSREEPSNGRPRHSLLTSEFSAMTVLMKNIHFCFIGYAKAFDCVDHKKLWKILQEMGIPDHPTCLLKNLYTGQESTFRTGHGTTDWFQIGKGVCQGYIL